MAAILFFVMVWADIFQFRTASGDLDIKKSEAVVLIAAYIIIMYLSYSL